MADTELTTMVLPAQVTIDPGAAPLHTPREMARIMSWIGKDWTDMTAPEAEQAAVWIALRRLGFDPTWDQAADVLVEYRTANPQNGGSQTTLPGSAISGE